MYSTVVVGADDSSTAREAVNVAADVAQAGGGKLHIVTASVSYTHLESMHEPIPGPLLASAHEKLVATTWFTL